MSMNKIKQNIIMKIMIYYKLKLKDLSMKI